MLACVRAKHGGGGEGVQRCAALCSDRLQRVGGVGCWGGRVGEGEGGTGGVHRTPAPHAGAHPHAHSHSHPTNPPALPPSCRSRGAHAEAPPAATAPPALRLLRRGARASLWPAGWVGGWVWVCVCACMGGWGGGGGGVGVRVAGGWVGMGQGVVWVASRQPTRALALAHCRRRPAALRSAHPTTTRPPTHPPRAELPAPGPCRPGARQRWQGGAGGVSAAARAQGAQPPPPLHRRRRPMRARPPWPPGHRRRPHCHPQQRRRALREGRRCGRGAG